MNIQISIATALLILVSLTCVMLGYLTSKVTYDTKLAERQTQQLAELLNQSLHLTKDSERLINGTKIVLANQIAAIAHKVSNISEAEKREMAVKENLSDILQNHSLVIAKNNTRAVTK